MMRKNNGNEKMFGEELIGLDKVRNAVEAVLSHMSKQGTEEFYERVFLFVGDRSCAKKTTANLMANALSERNILPSAHIVYKDAAELSSDERITEAVSDAKAGVLYLENAVFLKNRLPVLIDLIENKQQMITVLECSPTDVNSFLKYDRRLQEIVNSCSYNKIVFERHYSPENMKKILKLMADNADQIAEIRFNSPLSVSGRYLNLSYKVFYGLEKENGIKCSSGEFLKRYLNDSIYKMLSRNGNSISEKDIPDQYLKHIERVPYCISINQIETSGRSLFAMDLQRSLLFIETSHGTSRPLESTGVIITADGYALISSHCLKGMDTVNATVFWPDWHGGYIHVSYDCDICEPIDDIHNIAVIKLKRKGNETFCTASIRETTPINVKEKCYIMGCPHGENPFIYDGIISSRQLEETGKEYYTCTADSYPGNLGSPILGSDGRVLGLLAGKKVDPYDIDGKGDSFFYPITKILERIILEYCEAEGPLLDISEDNLPFY